MIRVLLTVLAASSLLAISGCGDSGPTGPPQSPIPGVKSAPVPGVKATPAAPVAAETAPPGGSEPTESTPAVEEPVVLLALGNAENGQPIYVSNCSSCHGAAGAGDGPMAATLDPKPARHDDGAYMNTLDNARLLKVIVEGGPAVGKSPLMAPWRGVLTDEQIADVAAFVRSLADPPYSGDS